MKHKQVTMSKTPNRDKWVERGIAVPVNNLHVIKSQRELSDGSVHRTALCGVTIGYMTFAERLTLRNGYWEKPGCALSVCKRCVRLSSDLFLHTYEESADWL